MHDGQLVSDEQYYCIHSKSTTTIFLYYNIILLMSELKYSHTQNTRLMVASFSCCNLLLHYTFTQWLSEQAACYYRWVLPIHPVGSQTKRQTKIRKLA